MFQSYCLTPINLQPPSRPNRQLHNLFAQKIELCCDALRFEKDVIDATNESAAALLSTMDAIMSHGLVENDKCYWRFVREFIPKSEQKLMETEWSAGSKRRLSFSWLKDSFNRNSIHFQLLAIQGARALQKKYYHPAACLRNYGVLEIIVFQIGKLQDVQFAYDRVGPHAHRQMHVAPELEDDKPSERTSQNGAQPVPTINLSDEERARPEEMPKEKTPPRPIDGASPVRVRGDHNVSLHDLVRHRRQRIATSYIDTMNEPSNTESEGCDPSMLNSDGSQKEERLDIVLQKTISQARLEHLDGYAKSFDRLLQLDENPPPAVKQTAPAAPTIVTEPEGPVVGEVQLHSGEVLRFVMDVFVDIDAGERFQKLFVAYEGMPSKDKTRLLLVTDLNIYLLTQSVEEAPMGTAPSDLEVTYTTHVVIPYNKIDYIEVTHGGIILTFYAAQNQTFTMTSTSSANVHNRVVQVVTGDQRLGKNIVESMASAVIVLGHKPPPIYENKAAFDIILQRFIKQQNLVSQEIRQIFIALWMETSKKIVAEEAVEPAYLFRREIARSWFSNKGNTDWEQSYFLLRDNKLYIFADASCHEGQRMIDLSGSRGLLIEEAEAQDHSHLIVITYNDNSTQISFPSVDEKHKWLYALQAATCQIPDSASASSVAFVTDSHIVIGQLGSNAHVDGFIRSLSTFKCELIQECIAYKKDGKYAIIIGIEDHFEWFIVRSEQELDRFRVHLSTIVNCVDWTEYSEESIATLIDSQMKKIPSVWNAPAYVSGVDNISDDEDSRDRLR